MVLLEYRAKAMLMEWSVKTAVKVYRVRTRENRPSGDVF